MPSEVTTFLRFDGKAEGAMTFSVSLFHGSEVTGVVQYTGRTPTPLTHSWRRAQAVQTGLARRLERDASTIRRKLPGKTEITNGDAPTVRALIPTESLESLLATGRPVEYPV